MKFAFLVKLQAELSRYGFTVSAGHGWTSTLPHFLVAIAREFDRFGFQTQKT